MMKPLRFAVALLIFGAAFPAVAADRDTWQHPDPRFAAIDNAVDEDDFPAAQKLLAELRNEARRTKDAGLQGDVVERGKEATRQSRDFEKIRKHLKTLESDPQDAKASLAVGKYYCVQKEQWKRGLALLAAGDDVKLAAIAAADSDDILQPDDQFQIADRWWQYAERVSDATERIAWQLRSRRWMIRARPGATDKQRQIIDQRLKQLPLFVDKIVVWNTHNGPSDDRGAEEINVSLFYQDKVVWNEAVPLPFKRDEPSFVLLQPKRIRGDQVRVEITKHHNRGGGLGEIQVFAGRTNVAWGCQPVVDAVWELNPQFVASRLVDGDVSGSTGYWLTDNDKDGWAEIHFSEFPQKD